MPLLANFHFVGEKEVRIIVSLASNKRRKISCMKTFKTM